MKKRQSIILLTAVAAFAGCAKTSDIKIPTDNVVRVIADVAMKTKGSCTTESLKEFDLMIKSRSSKYDYTNTKFTRDESGQWIPAKQMLWEGENVNAEYLAVSPCANAGISLGDGPLFQFQVSDRQTKDGTESDLLWCYGNKNETSFDDQGRMKLTFAHALSLLKVKLTFGTQFNVGGVPGSNPASSFNIDGFKTSVNVGYNTTTGTANLAADGSASTMYLYESSWIPAADVYSNCVAEFECIVVPQQVSTFTLYFYAAGNPYIFTANLGSDFSFESGKEYTLPLIVGKDVVRMSEDISAEAWKDGGSQDIETD